MSDKNEMVPVSAQTGSSALTVAGDIGGCRGGKLSGRHTTL